MPNTVLSIGEYAFNDCFRLEEVVLSNSLTTVGLHAFENCFIIDDIIIPTTLTNIGKNTLTYNHISRLFYKGTEEMFKEVDFLDSYSLQYIDIYYYSESEPVVEGNFWCLDENNQIHIYN